MGTILYKINIIKLRRVFTLVIEKSYLSAQTNLLVSACYFYSSNYRVSLLALAI